jgi:hypothetical protein
LAIQLQLEGNRLEDLLERVRAEYGSSARIVQADRVRRGGIAGFFARERFALTLDVDEPEAATAGGDVVPAEGASAEPVAAEPPTAVTSVLELVDAVNDEEQVNPAFAALLARYTESGGRPIPLAEEPDVAEPAAVVTPEPDVIATAEQPVTIDLDARRAIEIVHEVAAAPIELPRQRIAPPAPRPQLWGREVEQLRHLGVPDGLLPDPAALSLPKEFERALRIGSSYLELPSAPGDVIAVVGDIAGAWDTAELISAHLGLPGDCVVVAGRQRTSRAWLPNMVSSEAVAARQRMSWARATMPTVVAVDYPTVSPDDLAARLLAALRPTATLAVVSAATKPADISDFVQNVTPMDALAVTDTVATRTPAAVLELGVPIALVDGLPATPEVWSCLLLGRVMTA